MASKKTKWSTDEKIRIVLQTFNPETKVAELCREHNLAPRTLPCVTGVCARRCHVLAMRLVQSSCRLAGRFFKYSGPSQSGTCPVPDGIAGRRAARTGCPLHGSRDCPAGPRREDRQKSGKIRCAGGCGCPAGRSRLTLRLRLGDAPCPLHFPPDEFSVYSPVLGAAVQHLPDPF